MASDEFARRPVAFNLRDPHQRELYEYTRQFTNFSAYVKSLISADYVRKNPDYSADKSANNEVHGRSTPF